MTKIIGLTGGIGSGKSTVANYIASKGIPVYIADEEAKKIMERDDVKQKIQNLFTESILNSDNSLNRKKIAEFVFNNPDKLKELNAIVHPEVRLHFKNWLKEHKNHPFIIKEVAILFETGGNKQCDKVILITAPEELRIERAMKRDNLTKKDVLLILGFSIFVSIFLFLVFMNQLAGAGVFGILFLIISISKKDWRIKNRKYLPILLVEVLFIALILWIKVR